MRKSSESSSQTSFPKSSLPIDSVNPPNVTLRTSSSLIIKVQLLLLFNIKSFLGAALLPYWLWFFIK
ncbi:hypothetical protein L1987_55959 [Smallanthus sonchifolius]|uniref:Uncharacterized protein n=1 Tax=Smallanthus sonchifolius TaxID=185202 RepID=A0ACB9EBS3_9ASTR|nr:hypothetical protein L1987_55959 [Smallanthus sonchifolius]